MMNAEERHRVSRLLEAVTSRGLINDDCPSIDVFDKDYFCKRLAALGDSFPEAFVLNAVAVKANPIRGVLAEAAAKGFGAECASMGEVLLALSVGFPCSKVVYDSPVKTAKDMARAIRAGVVMNLDNDHEMRLVDELLGTSCRQYLPCHIGLRINPVVGPGTIDSLSTATPSSKFGLAVTVAATRSKVIGLFKQYEWLTGVHFHVGSQGVPMDMFVQASKICMEFVSDVEKATGRSLEFVDIGGGLSSSYVSPEEPASSSYALYRSALEAAVPQLFSGKYRLITEFGRSLLLKAGISLARVEYVKNWLDDVRPILLIHVGANQFVREAYVGQSWYHRHSVADKNGKLKTGEKTTHYDVAGPLCFQGDFIAKDVHLPAVEQGDLLVIHDTGAYSMSLYSKYNSILPSAVYGVRSLSDGSLEVQCMKERESPEEALYFWGSPTPRIV